MIFILLELFISFRSYPSRNKCLAGLISFALSYLVWLHVVKYYSGVWVYPVLEVLPFPMRVLFFIGAIFLIVVLYLLGEKLNEIVWSREIKSISKKGY